MLLVKKIISKIVQNDIAWSVIDATVVRLSNFVLYEKKRKSDEKKRDIDNSELEKKIKSFSPNLTVLHGSFKGMRYPEVKSIGSSLAPKIIGSYERELHQVLEQICLKEYSEIVDVGCAEGYYAVGLAMRIPTAKIFAYDINNDAIYLCKQMAHLNNVEDRLVTGSFCDVNTLKSIPYTKKALIISDCEGYEKNLFTEELAPVLASHDLLIEVHDYIDIEISSEIRRKFKDTHSVTTIQSIDDITKAHIYDYEELKEYSLEDKKTLLKEDRPHIMEWLYMTPHSNLALG
jgi:hypothetical protein